MNKLPKTILIGLITVFGVGILLVPSALAQGIMITPEPIFNVDNFFPSQSVTSTVTIENNSGKDYEKISLQGEPVSGDIDFASALELKINDLVEKNLGALLNGETLLLSGGIDNNQTRTFDFAMRFKEGGEADNQYQGKTITFDFIFVFGEKEVVMVPVRGIGLPPGLTISEETVRAKEITETSATITWTTNYFSTSLVIYDTVAGKFDLAAGPPNYGYTYSKIGDDSGLEKVTAHSVTITGLLPGTTYYYRCVSHASLSISREYSFTTLGVKEKEIIPPEEEIVAPEEKIPAEEIVLAPPEEEIMLPSEEEVIPPEEGVVVLPPEERVAEKGLASLVAAAGMVIGEISQSAWRMIIVILCLIGLVLIGIREWERVQKRKKQI